MKKIISVFLFSILTGAVFSQTGNLRFTIERNPAQVNQVLIRVKNFSGSLIAGTLGASKLTLCIAIPSNLAGLNYAINTPIVGQTFGPVLRSLAGSDSIFTWNADGNTSSVNFASNVDVDIANVTITGGAPGATSTVRLACLTDGGPSFFDYCYIAPNGTDEGGFANPFYSNTPANPLLLNCNGSLPGPTCNSFVGVASVTLPVKFLSFYALKTGDDAKLNWTVENDEDNKQFEIERSVDGRNFSKFTTVKAFANGKAVNTYDGLDNRLSGLGANTIYYRVKQLDRSGTATYSPIRSLNVGTTGSANLFPNPARSFSKLVVDAPKGGKASIVLRDATGKQAMMVNTNFVKGINQIELNVAKLSSGEYNVSIVSEGFSETIKMSKIN